MAANKSVSNLSDHAGYWLRYVSNHVSHVFARRVEAHGVTVAEWGLLRQMLNAGTTNPSRLAEAVGMTRGAVSKLVERLCRKKLAERSSSDTDNRYQTVGRTASERRVPVLVKLADENDHEFFGHLTPEDRATLVNVLQGLVHRHGWKDLPIN